MELFFFPILFTNCIFPVKVFIYLFTYFFIYIKFTLVDLAFKLKRSSDSKKEAKKYNILAWDFHSCIRIMSKWRKEEMLHIKETQHL